MAQVFRDIATANLEGRGAAILSYVLPHGRDFSAKGNGSVSLSDGETVSSHGRCRKCGQKVAEIINIKGKGELHVMEQPCTRLVLGINDEAREANEKESGKNIEFMSTAAQTNDDKHLTAQERQELVEAEKLFQEGLASIRDLIAPSSMEINYDHMRVEEMYAQSFIVYSYPRFIDANWLSPVINFDVAMDISQFIYPIDSSKIMKILKTIMASDGFAYSAPRRGQPPLRPRHCC